MYRGTTIDNVPGTTMRYIVYGGTTIANGGTSVPPIVVPMYLAYGTTIGTMSMVVPGP